MKKNTTNNTHDKFSFISLGEMAGYAIEYLTCEKIQPLQREKEEMQSRYNNEINPDQMEMFKTIIHNYDEMMLPWVAKREAVANIYKLTTGEDYPNL